MFLHKVHPRIHAFPYRNSGAFESPFWITHKLGTSAVIVNDWITQSVSSIFELLGKRLHSGALSIQRLQGAET